MAPHRRDLLPLAAGLALAAPAARAQPAWPTRPIRLIVAFAPGGFTDIAARVLAAQLGQQLGQQVVVDNRAGAAGIIGTEAAMRAEPDGYTLLMGTISTHAMNVGLYRRLPYDPVAGFTPVSRVATGPSLLVAHPSLGITDLATLIARAREKPGDITCGSAGNGTSSHLAMELLQAQAGIQFLHVPFRSTSTAAQALLAGQVQVMFDPIPSSLPQVRDGRMTAIAVTAARRLAELPAVPAMAETLPGFEMGVWVGIFGPAGLPAPIVARIDAATRQALASPELVGRFAELGMLPFPGGPQELRDFLAAEIDRWVAVVRRAGITAD
jgi:tripartite-type tricarboxylate transporter receptor subunit TctC